jgi:hypothetical protein
MKTAHRLIPLIAIGLGCESNPIHPTPVDHKTPPPAVTPNSDSLITGSGGSYGQYDQPGQLRDPSHQSGR